MENTSNSATVIEVTEKDLPIQCTMNKDDLWCSHPRVFIPVKAAGDEASCSYCGTVYKYK